MKNKQILTAILSITLVFFLALGGITFAGDEYYDGGVISGEFGNSTSGGTGTGTDENGGGTGTGTDENGGGNGGTGQDTPAPDNSGIYNGTIPINSGTTDNEQINGTAGGGSGTPDPGEAADFDVTGIQDKTYNGKAQTQNLIVKSSSGDQTMTEGADYIVAYSNNTNAGTATVKVTGKGSYNGTVTKTFKIKKAANTLKVKKKTAKLTAKALKKKGRKLPASKVMTISGRKGTLSCKITAVSKKKYKKYFKMSKNGTLTVKKKLRKGTYKITAKVTAAGNANYNAATRTVKITIKVR